MSEKQNLLVGVDIGASSIKAVELKRVGGEIQVAHLGIEPLASDIVVDSMIVDSTAVSNAIAKIFAKSGIKGKAVATSVGGHSVIVKKVAMQTMTDDELAAVIQTEAAQHIPFDIQDVDVDFQILSEDLSGPEMDVLLVAVKKDEVLNHTKVLSLAAKSPPVVDFDAFALQSCYEYNYEPERDLTVALLDLGADAMSINIVRGGKLLFAREVNVGGNQYTGALQKELDLSFESAEALKLGKKVGAVSEDVEMPIFNKVNELIVREIQKTLAFFRATASGGNVERVYLAGGSTNVPGLVEEMRLGLSLPVEVLNPFQKIGYAAGSGVVPQNAPQFSVAVGLALKNLEKVQRGASKEPPGRGRRLATAGGPGEPPPKKEGYRIVDVLYATDRRATGKKKPAKFFGSERSQDGSLALGTCEVSIPWDHRIGELESPSIGRLEFWPNPKKHVVLLRIQMASEAGFYGRLCDGVAASARKEAFVFIHGYSVTFEDAARRTAQLACDLKFSGPPILYSWPSQGSVAKYTVDETNIEWTIPHLRGFLERVVSESGAATLHLIAHSMGNRALTRALAEISRGLRPTARAQFRQVVLTAPDIDAEVFKQLAAAVQSTAERVTLYASSEDEALKLSKQFHGYPRAGDAGETIVICPGVDTVDVSAVDTSLLGHSYYADNRSVISDLFNLLREGAPPGQRFGISAVRLGDLQYWRFQP